MRVVMTGASGLIGTAISRRLRERGDDVVALVRRVPRSGGEVQWNPDAPLVLSGELEGLGAAIHLAGESIMGLWTPEKKRAIRDSRVQGTKHLCDALAAMERPPRVLICASAVGIYGDRGEETVTESAEPGVGFLAQVSREWEAATSVLSGRHDVRVVALRLGVVLSRNGGFLRAVLPAYKLGLGATFGGGQNWLSWVALDDVVAAVEHILSREDLDGPVNMTSPSPVTNKEFAHTLARVLNRPAFLDVPGFVVRTLLRDMAEEMLLGGVKALPAKLQASGFAFQHANLEDELAEMVR